MATETRKSHALAKGRAKEATRHDASPKTHVPRVRSTTMNNARFLDKYAADTSECFSLPAKAVGTRFRDPKHWAWWDQECKDANSKAAGGSAYDRREYRRVLLRTRREHYKEFVSTAGPDRLWKVMSRHLEQYDQCCKRCN